MENALVLKGIKKYFPGTKALDWNSDQIVEFKAGEIHGLVEKTAPANPRCSRF